MITVRCRPWCAVICAALLVCAFPRLSWGDSSWELSPQSRKALDRGLQWLQRNQGPEGNWTTNDLGLVSMGLLAFLSDGHAPGRGRYGIAGQKALDYVLRNAKNRSGLLNIAGKQRDMYNHGLSTFVLGQAYGMTNDPRVGPALDSALKVIDQCQCQDGGWQYVAQPLETGHDLSLAVMQAKALRSAVDSGFEVRPSVIERAVRDVREHYQPNGCPRDAPEEEQQKHPGRFAYDKGGGQQSLAMAAAGVVCLQEFAQYDDWRIPKNVEIIEQAVREMSKGNPNDPPFDPYTTYYVAQALYQVGGEPWKRCYPLLRDRLISSQMHENNPENDGGWRTSGQGVASQVGGKPGVLYQTAVACFVLAIPNRYLPILQEGKIDSLRKQFEKK
ncbi:MAG: squalene--hopene cyclase [Thermoguttaceae bacterium]